MKGHKFYTDWDEFWEFYISKIKNDIGESKMKVTLLFSNFKKITKNT